MVASWPACLRFDAVHDEVADVRGPLQLLPRVDVEAVAEQVVDDEGVFADGCACIG